MGVVCRNRVNNEEVWEVVFLVVHSLVLRKRMKLAYLNNSTCYLLGRKVVANKGLSSQSYGFSSGHVWMWELDYKDSWAPKSWCFGTVVLEKTLESPFGCKEIQPVHPKGYPFWMFIGRTDVEAETPIIWAPDVKSWLIGKDPDDGRDWGQEEKGTTEDEMVGWHHQLDGHGFWWTPGVVDGQGGLACSLRLRHDWVTELNWLWKAIHLSIMLLIHGVARIMLD